MWTLIGEPYGTPCSLFHLDFHKQVLFPGQLPSTVPDSILVTADLQGLFTFINKTVSDKSEISQTIELGIAL